MEFRLPSLPLPPRVRSSPLSRHDIILYTFGYKGGYFSLNDAAALHLPGKRVRFAKRLRDSVDLEHKICWFNDKHFHVQQFLLSLVLLSPLDVNPPSVYTFCHTYPTQLRVGRQPAPPAPKGLCYFRPMELSHFYGKATLPFDKYKFIGGIVAKM